MGCAQGSQLAKSRRHRMSSILLIRCEAIMIASAPNDQIGF
jgi:hypothetical protein